MNFACIKAHKRGELLYGICMFIMRSNGKKVKKKIFLIIFIKWADSLHRVSTYEIKVKQQTLELFKLN